MLMVSDKTIAQGYLEVIKLYKQNPLVFFPTICQDFTLALI